MDKEGRDISEAISQHILNSPSYKIYRRKIDLIDEIKRCYGEGCIDDSTKKFKKQNIVIFQHKDTEVILYFHFSNEIGFFGCDVGYVDRIANYIIENPSKKICSYIYLILNEQEIAKTNFAIPVFFVKNNQSDISKTEFKGSVPPQYKFNILYKNGKYWLRLKNNTLTEISNFIADVKYILSGGLVKIHNEEKEKYINKVEAQKNLLKKFGKL